MMSSSADDLRSARIAITTWLDATKVSPDPTTQLAATAGALHAKLKRAAAAVAEANANTESTDDWKTETAQYRAALAALKSQLEHVEIILRMRAANLKRRRIKIDALRTWADLARNIQ